MSASLECPLTHTMRTSHANLVRFQRCTMIFLMTEFAVALVPLRIMSTAYRESEWINTGDLCLMSGRAASTWANKKRAPR